MTQENQKKPVQSDPGILEKTYRHAVVRGDAEEIERLNEMPVSTKTVRED